MDLLDTNGLKQGHLVKVSVTPGQTYSTPITQSLVWASKYWVLSFVHVIDVVTRWFTIADRVS